MAAMRDGFESLENTIMAMMESIAPNKRKQKLREIGTLLRRHQMKRIEDQKNPDGSDYKPRKRRLPGKVREQAKKFLYPAAGVGEPRVVLVKSYTMTKKLITGFDVERNAVRSFLRSKIIQPLPLSDSEKNKRVGEWQNSTKKQNKMFKKIRLPRFLKTQLEPDQLSVGFSGRVAGIARAHQYGKKNRPIRELIGLSREDEAMITDKVMELFNDD